MVFIPFIFNSNRESRFSDEQKTGGWIKDKWGQYIIVTMKNAPFPHKSRHQGHSYQEKFYPANKHYQDSSVGILVPANYRKTPQLDVIVHFHGWGNSVEHEITQFDFRPQLYYSRKNAIMVLPQGPKDAKDSTCGKIEDPDGLKNLLTEMADFLFSQGITNTKSLGTVIISGHSGGYRPVAFCLDQGGLEENIKEVYLFDAAYSYLDSFSRWGSKKNKRLVSICTNHLLDENVELMRNLQKQGRNNFSIFLDDDATTKNLAQNSVSFIYTGLSHNELVFQPQYFTRFVHTSSLPEIIWKNSSE